MKTMPINVADHYWVIGGSTAEVYASKTNTLVPVGDADYTAWLVINHAPTPIANEGELAGALASNGSTLPAWLLASDICIQPTPTTYSKIQLKDYSATARWDKMRGGIVVNGIPFPTDPITLGSLNSAFIYTSDQIKSFSWKLPDGTFITLDTQGVKDLQNSVSKFGQDCFACEDANADAIDAGTLIDLPAIDATYAAISNLFTGAVQRRKK